MKLQNIVYLVDMRAANMNDQEIQAALLQISKMEEAAKAGHFSILQVELAELQNQLDWITRRDHLNKNSYYKITPKTNGLHKGT